MDSHQQKFQSNKGIFGETPEETMARVRDYAYEWLRPEKYTKEQIVDMVILEMFLEQVPMDLEVWLRNQEPKSSKDAASLAKKFPGKQKPDDVIMLPDTTKDLSVSLTKDNWVSPEPERNTFYFKVAENCKTPLSGNQPNNWLTTLTTTHSQVQTAQQLFSTPCNKKKDPIVVVKTEKVCEEENLQKEKSQIAPLQFLQEKVDQSWYLPLVRQGNTLQEEKEKIENILEGILKSEVNINTEKELSDHPYRSLTESDSSTSLSEGDDDMSTSETSSFRRSESENSLKLGSDFMNLSKLLELNPPSYPIFGKDLSNSQTTKQPNCSQTSDSSTAAIKRYTCENCEKSFAWKSSLSRHRLIHTGEKSHRCPDCDKSFYVRSALVAHQRIHTGVKPFQCETCGKSFYIRSALVVHQRIHTGEKPFQCGTCGKSFYVNSSLVAHQRIHTGEKPFRCGTCGKCFKIKSYLSSHELIHREKQFHCPLCGKKFRRRAQLKSHCKAHTGEKHHQCYICGKCFQERSSLVRHEKLHAMRETTRKVSLQVFSA